MVMLMVAIASGKHHASPGSSLPESRSAAFNLGTKQGS